jgi:hypothetical protein
MYFFTHFLTLVGFIVGLGAVTVIDLHGFLGRHSPYWTEATIRTHKITKPLIWIGTILVLIGTCGMYSIGLMAFHALLVRLTFIAILMLNGCFLSFVVSPALIRQERTGKATELLPAHLQHQITASFLVSFTGWWSLVALSAGLLIH